MDKGIFGDPYRDAIGEAIKKVESGWLTAEDKLALIERWAHYWSNLSEQEFQGVGEELLAIIEGTSTEEPDDD